MRYIEYEDLLTYIQQPLLDGSIAGTDGRQDTTLLDRAEDSAIELVKGYLRGRYDCDSIFGLPVVRNGVLIQIICCITIYRVIRRNAARKLPEDIYGFYTDAIKLLEQIQSGALKLDDVPEPEDGETKMIWGNTTNKNYFI